MKKTMILMISIICIFVLSSCSNVEDPSPEPEVSSPVSADVSTDMPTDVSTEEVTSSAAAGVIPASLVFTTDGTGRYVEPMLGEWDRFLAGVFKSFDSGELDPGSGNIKYYGEGNDGYGYCFIVTTRSDSGSIISYNIDTAIISAEPNSGGDEVSGQDMVRWIYDNFHKEQ